MHGSNAYTFSSLCLESSTPEHWEHILGYCLHSIGCNLMNHWSPWGASTNAGFTPPHVQSTKRIICRRLILTIIFQNLRKDPRVLRKQLLQDSPQNLGNQKFLLVQRRKIAIFFSGIKQNRSLNLKGLIGSSSNPALLLCNYFGPQLGM